MQPGIYIPIINITCKKDYTSHYLLRLIFVLRTEVGGEEFRDEGQEGKVQERQSRMREG